MKTNAQRHTQTIMHIWANKQTIIQLAHTILNQEAQARLGFRNKPTGMGCFELLTLTLRVRVKQMKWR